MTARRQIRLTTRGRRSGEQRAVTLFAWPDGENLVVVGSAGGQARHPAWVLNLRTAPDAKIQDGKQHRPVRAREAAGRERERLWQLVTEAFPLYATYQRRADRTLPIFVLEPLSD